MTGSRPTNVGSSFGGREQPVADLDLVGEFAAEKLVDQTGNFRLFFEELPELPAAKGESPHVAFGDHRRGGPLVGQERDLAHEAALLQERDLAAPDHDSGAARANEEDSVERLVFGGERRATGEIAKFAGDEQARDLWDRRGR